MKRACFVALLLLATGCHNATEETECSHFIEKVNGSLIEINKHTHITGLDGPKMVAEMNTLADLYDKLARDIGAMSISTSELAARTEDYRRMAQSAATAARHLATAVKNKDVKAIDASDKEFKDVVSRESQLIASIDRVCKR